MPDEAGRADLRGPAGNVYDKYGSRNPLARLLVDRFLAVVDETVAQAAPTSVFDVGCGEGVVTERIARLHEDTAVVGLDVEDAVLLAKWRQREGGNLTFRPGSAYALPYRDGAFDLVCALELLEHLERPRAALAELARVTSSTLLLSVPREPLWRLLNVLSGRYLRALGNTPGHLNHWSRAGFVQLAGDVGEVRSVRSPVPWTVVTLRVGR